MRINAATVRLLAALLLAVAAVGCSDTPAEQAVAPTATTTASPSPSPTLPDVVGDFEADALQQLRAMQLDPYPVLVDSDEPAGTVVALRPPPGRQVRSGDVVVVEVAFGPSPDPTSAVSEPPDDPGPPPAEPDTDTERTLTVPAVTGRMLDEATERLLEAGIDDIVNEEADVEGRTQCYVYDQKPQPGTLIGPDTVVTIYSYMNLGECGEPIQ